MIDNFKLLSDFMTFNTVDDFYYLQIYKRKKDNPELKGDNKTIKNFHIYSHRQLEEDKQLIIDICHAVNGRAYIRPTKRNSSKVALESMDYLVKSLKAGRPIEASAAYSKACGKIETARENQLWTVDVDSHDFFHQVNVRAHILLYLNAGREIKLEVPTLNGLHFITQPFDTRQFVRNFPEISIHKDNPTLLYANV